MVYRLILSYRGTAYAGWQRQDNALAVQEVVETAVARLVGPTDRPVVVVGASRTDAGVHARGQAAHVELQEPAAALPPRALVHGVNHHLPEDVRVLSAAPMRTGFHARKSATAKEYRYRLSRAAVLSPLDALFAVRVDGRIDPGRLAAAAALLPGRHDFSAFAAAGGSHRDPRRRIFSAGWSEAGEELLFTVVGDGFLRGMVRALVGTMIEVGLGKREFADFGGLLRGGPRALAGPTAPAHGLVLEHVFYADEWLADGPADRPVMSGPDDVVTLRPDA